VAVQGVRICVAEGSGDDLQFSMHTESVNNLSPDLKLLMRHL
jgi:hypothetical protein